MIGKNGYSHYVVAQGSIIRFHGIIHRFRKIIYRFTAFLNVIPNHNGYRRESGSEIRDHIFDVRTFWNRDRDGVLVFTNGSFMGISIRIGKRIGTKAVWIRKSNGYRIILCGIIGRFHCIGNRVGKIIWSGSAFLLRFPDRNGRR